MFGNLGKGGHGLIMKIGIVQMHSEPGNVEANVKKGIMRFMEAAERGVSLVVFPELWTCGYYLEREGFEQAAGKTQEILDEFRKLAGTHGIVTILPVPQKKANGLSIGLYVIERDGTVTAEYQKSFLWGREQNYFVRGRRCYEPVTTSLGVIGVLICYDIEFPEPARILALKGAQILFVPSVWSIPAQNRWNIQLPARALDNTVFVAGINNVGEGACGQSKVLSPLGDVMAEASPTEEELLLVEVDLSQIGQIREKIPYLKEYDPELTPGGSM